MKFLLLRFSSLPQRHLQIGLWFGLSVAIALTYSGLSLLDAFSAANVVQDDARQHVFWMQRFLDGQLFPNDLIADYFQSTAPPGYSGLYRFFAAFGINPLLLNKLLPVGLGLLATGFGFGVAMELLPIPAGAFVASLLLNQYLWANDDIASATARGFMPPLMLAFVYFLLRRQRQAIWKTLLPLLLVIALEGWFYPTYVLIFAGILVLLPLRWSKGGLRWHGPDFVFTLTGLGAAVLVLLPYLLEASPFDPIVTVAEARQLPEFSPSGRTAFFYDDQPSLYWLSARRSGLMPTIRPPIICLGLLLPLLALFPRVFPLMRQVGAKVGLLVRWGVVAIALFLLAHLLLFRLYLPSRYTHYSLQFILVFTSALTFMVLLDGAWRWVQRRYVLRTDKSTAVPSRRESLLAKGVLWMVVGAIAIARLCYPLYAYEFPRHEYRVGQYPAIYEFLRRQPKDALVASVLLEADSISSFAQRSVYVSREHAVPYQTGYANPFRQRANELIEALYTPDLAKLQDFIRRSGVDYWMVTPDQFTLHFLQNSWIQQYPGAIAQATTDLSQGVPAILSVGDRCTILTTPAQPLNPVTQSRLLARSETWIQNYPISLVDSACLLRQPLG